MDPPTLFFLNLKKKIKMKNFFLYFGNFAIARPVCTT